MIQQDKPMLACSMPVLWPTLVDLGRDECKRILRKLELEAYAGVISALRAQGDLTKDKKDLLGELTKVLSISTERHRAEVRRAVNDERLTTIAYHMSGPNSSSEWSIEGRRLVPLMPRLVPQTAFTVTANAVANASANQNASLLMPAETGNKEVVVCYSYTSTTSTPTSTSGGGAGLAGGTVKASRPASPASNVVVLPSGSTVYVKSVSCSDEEEKPRKRRRTNSSSSTPVLLKEAARVTPPLSKTISVPVSAAPKISNIMQSIASSLPPHMSPVKITFTKPTTQTTNTTTQKVIIVTTSPSSNFVPNILSKSHSHNYAAVSKLVSTSMLTSASQKQTVVIPASSAPSSSPNTVAVTTMVTSSPSVVMSTIAHGGSAAGVRVASARLPSPKTLMGSPTQILAQFPKQASLAGGSTLGQAQTTAPGSKPSIQNKQESGVKIITQQVQPSKILPKPSSAALPCSNSSPIMVVSSNGAIMTSKLVSQPTGSQATYSRPSMTPTIGARVTTSPGGATYVKTTSGSIITVVPKSLATLGGKILSSSMVSGTTTKITTIPMTSKPNVIVVQKTTGKGTTIQGLPGKNVVTTLLNAGGEKTLQGAKPAIITASRPITKMIVTQPKALGPGSQPSTTTKIIPTKIVYGQQGKTQVLIKPKPVFQAALVSEARQQASRSTDPGQEGALKDEDRGSSPPEDLFHSGPPESQPVVHLISSRGQEWAEQEVLVESSPTIMYQEVSGGREEQQTTVKEKNEANPRQHMVDLCQMVVHTAQEKEPPGSSCSSSEPRVDFTTAGKVLKHAEISQEEGELEGDTLDPQTGLFYRSSPALQGLPSSRTQPDASRHTPHSTQIPAPPSQSRPQPSPSSTSPSLGKSPPLLQEPPLPSPLPLGLSLREKSSVLAPGVSQAPTAPSKLLVTPQAPAPSKPLLTPQVPAPSKPLVTPQASAPSKPLVTPQASAPSKPLVTPQASAPSKPLVPPQAPVPPAPSKPLVTPQSTAPSKPLVTPQAPCPSAPSKPLVTPQAPCPSAPSKPLVTPQAPCPSAPSKPLVTPQLPRLQQAPTSHHRPLHTQLSQPPPLQAHHPVASDKLPLSCQPPIITQGASVTKITFGLQTAPVCSAEARRPEAKPSDILKISMMEAEIDPSAEPMLVDSSSDCSPYGGALAGGPEEGSSPLISSSLPPSRPPQLSRLQSSDIPKSRDTLDVIEVIPQFSIMPDSSQSNVVVEPSGFLQISDYTSQRLEEDSMEVDSSVEEAAAVSPNQEGVADQSQ
ncbi:BRCA2-interacting transcriptional repressor EMSY [Hypomesus transpacificus]|uniref:BRCA2-interacting transcriptional repressor EMSY n=1 Tax=Hypomesus transpacificus TaxID=137520 RepID=UPI001F083723|nr:BRCA2-interacting transcriptional repressor EMSY [Hypomesus transpacificus]